MSFARRDTMAVIGGHQNFCSYDELILTVERGKIVCQAYLHREWGIARCLGAIARNMHSWLSTGGWLRVEFTKIAAASA